MLRSADWYSWPRKTPRALSYSLTFCWGGSESGWSCPRAPAPKSCGRYWAESNWRKVGVGHRTGVAHRNVQFVGGDDSQSRISKLPPVLMSDRGDLYLARWFWSILNRVPLAQWPREQDDDNQNWG